MFWFVFYQKYHILDKDLGVWPSGKANDSDPLIVGSNPATPAKHNPIRIKIF